MLVNHHDRAIEGEANRADHTTLLPCRREGIRQRIIPQSKEGVRKIGNYREEGTRAKLLGIDAQISYQLESDLEC